MQAAYLDKLEATGRFSSGTMECLRRKHATLEYAYHNPAGHHSLEQINQSCRGGQQVVRDTMQKVENIPNLSQAEFDDDWGRMCP